MRQALKIFDEVIDAFELNESASQPNPARDFDSLEEAIEQLLADTVAAVRAIKPEIAIEFRQGEAIALDQVVDRDGAFMLLIRRATPERSFIERDADQAVGFGHVPSPAGAESAQSRSAP